MKDSRVVPQVAVTSVTFDQHCALLVVDVQNDFADPAGSLAVAGARQVVERANELVEQAVAEGALVVYTQDWHPKVTPHFAKDGGVWPVHCVGGTWGAELHPELIVRGEMMRKGMNGEDGYSGFTMRDPSSGDESSTGLAELLHEREVERIVVVGLATDYCVRATAIDGLTNGFVTAVVRDAIAAVDLEPGDGERALAELVQAGITVA